MATRNLSRTIIEGGRTVYWKMACERQTRTERRETRRVLQEATGHHGEPDHHDVETALTCLPAADQERYYSGELGIMDLDVQGVRLEELAARIPTRKTDWETKHRDRLAPLARLLASYVGKHWGESLNLIRKKHCEGSPTQRWHFLDHIQFEVADFNAPGYNRWGFYVDESGVLRQSPRRSHGEWQKPQREIIRDWNDLHRSVGFGLRIIEVDGVLHWTEATKMNRCPDLSFEDFRRLEKEREKPSYRRRSPLLAIPEPMASRAMVQQWKVTEQLSKEQLEAFGKLPRKLQKQLLLHSTRTAKVVGFDN